MAQSFKGNSDAGLQRLQQREQAGLEAGACSLPEHMPLSENLGMLLKLKYSLTAHPGLCWSYLIGQMLKRREEFPKEAALLPVCSPFSAPWTPEPPPSPIYTNSFGSSV